MTFNQPRMTEGNPCITEKVLRPIACKRFFIVVGPAKVLYLLRSKGFDTFDDIINGSYDDEIDPMKRWAKLREVISNTVSTPLAELKKIIDRQRTSIGQEPQSIEDVGTQRD